MPVNARAITAVDWSLKLGALGEVVEGLADIEQCLRIILGTPRGSVPHRPDFGCDIWRYLDQPVTLARPQIVREAIDAIGQWEPRVEVVAVRVLDGVADPAQAGAAVVLQVEWRLSDQGGRVVETSVAIGGAA